MGYFRSLPAGVYRSLFPGNTLKNKELKMINFTVKLEKPLNMSKTKIAILENVVTLVNESQK